ncbi:hypothetical protein KKC45_01775 [Patescibacteria group bacterium]|nr:hypothetical protein [Patescibacteria group bacterium]
MRDCMLSNYPKMSLLSIALIAIGMGLALIAHKILLGVFISGIGFLIFFVVFKKFITKN